MLNRILCLFGFHELVEACVDEDAVTQSEKLRTEIMDVGPEFHRIITRVDVFDKRRNVRTFVKAKQIRRMNSSADTVFMKDKVCMREGCTYIEHAYDYLIKRRKKQLKKLTQLVKRIRKLDKKNAIPLRLAPVTPEDKYKLIMGNKQQTTPVSSGELSIVEQGNVSIVKTQ